MSAYLLVNLFYLIEQKIYKSKACRTLYRSFKVSKGAKNESQDVSPLKMIESVLQEHKR